MKKYLFFLMFLLMLAPRTGFAGEGFILLSSTIGPIDSGIVSVLEDRFEQETGIRVRHVGAGTGAALDIAKKGQVIVRDFSKDTYGSPLFFPNSDAWKKQR